MSEKQKTCLTKEQRQEIRLTAFRKYYNPKEPKTFDDALMLLTEKAIMKKAVPKSEHDKLKEELKRVEWSYDTLYKLHEELKLEFENSIPKEKVRKVLDKVENKWPLCNKSEIFIDIKKQLLGEKK